MGPWKAMMRRVGRVASGPYAVKRIGMPMRTVLEKLADIPKMAWSASVLRKTNFPSGRPNGEYYHCSAKVGDQESPLDIRGELGCRQAPEEENGDGEVEDKKDEPLHRTVVQHPDDVPKGPPAP